MDASHLTVIMQILEAKRKMTNELFNPVTHFNQPLYEDEWRGGEGRGGMLERSKNLARKHRVMLVRKKAADVFRSARSEAVCRLTVIKCLRSDG